MEHARFTALSRNLRSRRRALGGLALAVAAWTAIPGEDLSAFKKRKARCKLSAKKCGRKCVDTRNDARHCGGCGKQCPEGVDCSDGICGGPVA